MYVSRGFQQHIFLRVVSNMMDISYSRSESPMCMCSQATGCYNLTIATAMMQFTVMMQIAICVGKSPKDPNLLNFVRIGPKFPKIVRNRGNSIGRSRLQVGIAQLRLPKHEKNKKLNSLAENKT